MKNEKGYVMRRFSERANAVVSRASNTGKLISVWWINGRPKVMGADTNVFAEGMDRHPEKLVGVYDGECMEEWVEEDLEWIAGDAIA